MGSTMLAALVAGISLPAFAQADYPQRPIRIVVPVPPGPTADALPRLIAGKLETAWKQPVIIENRPGAALNLAAEVVSRAAPDGYTLLATPSPPLAINASLYPKLAFDPQAFVPITILAESPNVLLVHPKVSATTLQDLIVYARANPGKLTYASSGSGSTSHLAMEMLKRLAGFEALHVPYKALGPAMTDLLGGHVDILFDNLGNAAGPVRDGRIRALAIGSERRADALPDVPALAELFPGFRSVAWFALVAPPKTPSAIAAKLSSAIAQAIREPDVAKRLQDLSATPIAGTPEETAAFITDERARWGKVIVDAGIKAN